MMLNRLLSAFSITALLTCCCVGAAVQAQVASPRAPEPQSASRSQAAAAKEATKRATEAKAVAPEPDESARPKRLSEAEISKKLREIPRDKRPKSIIRNIHYIVSNENRHYLWRSAIEGKGGIYVGVGAEQNYILAGWSRPEVLVLMDFDQWIVDLHEGYKALFIRAETPEQFLELWSKKRRPEAVAAITATVKARKDQARIISVFRSSRHRVERHLRKIAKEYRSYQSPCFLTDEAQYTHIRSLALRGHFLAVRGDLTADKAVKGISTFARAVNIPVRVFYLSNAEYYFSYSQGRYRSNMTSLFVDDESVILHTHPYQGWSYHYIYQSGLNFKAWLTSRKVGSLRSMMRRGRVLHDRELRLIDKSPAK